MHPHENLPNSIKSWAEADRPREKFAQHGSKTLSDAELLAILINSGNQSESAVDLAKKILQNYQHNLDLLGRASLKELQRFKGIGEAKSITIAAALELGRRRQATETPVPESITQSEDAYSLLASIGDLPHEEFWILLLNRANHVLKKINLSTGGLTGTVVDVKRLFQRVLEHERAQSIILAHNHPSGSLQPSAEDLNITRRIVEAGKLLDIKVLDHLIIAGNSYVSFADRGWMG